MNELEANQNIKVILNQAIEYQNINAKDNFLQNCFIKSDVSKQIRILINPVIFNFDATVLLRKLRVQVAKVKESVKNGVKAYELDEVHGEEAIEPL
jgi:hypothetical protein